MNTPTRVSLILGVVLALVIGAFFLLSPSDKSGDQGDLPETSDTDTSGVVREDSHVLGERGSSDVTFVEFLDFQCPSCASIQPVIKDLREKYEGEVTFVQRQFPLPSHPLAISAAVASEAAAQQGKLEEMTEALFTSQTEWSPKSADEAAAHFRDLADQVGLDLDAYDKALEDPALTERVERDVADGNAAGVDSTPTLFVNDTKLEPRSVEDIYAAIDKALDQ